MANNSVLHDVLTALLNEQHMDCHHAIREALHDRGFEVSQSKLSRLMRQWHMIKQTDESGEAYYVVQPEQSVPHPKMCLGELVTFAGHNGQMVVLRVSPGAASLIARLLDHRKGALGLLGVVAGDDTIFAAPTAVSLEAGLDALTQSIRSFLFV